MYRNGQALVYDDHFNDHLDSGIPVQIYWAKAHHDIGYVETYCADFVKVNNTFYNRHSFTFISRPGY